MTTTIEEAREFAIRQIAGYVHLMMCEQRITLEKLKVKLVECEFTRMDLLDAILAGEPKAGELCIRDLAMLAYAMDCRWDFSIHKLPDETEQAAEPPPPSL